MKDVFNFNQVLEKRNRAEFLRVFGSALFLLLVALPIIQFSFPLEPSIERHMSLEYFPVNSNIVMNSELMMETGFDVTP